MRTSNPPAVPTPGHGAPVEPLVLTRDRSLTAELQRLAAAAGTSLHVVADPLEARARWSGAPVVLLGADLLDVLATSSMPRRPAVHVVAQHPLHDTGFRAALAVGAESVVELPAAESWVVGTLADTADGAAGRATVVGVVGGCGGVGATTFAAALALTAAAAGFAVTLVDADPLGAGLESVAGVVDEGTGWGSLMESTGRLGSRALRAALPHAGDVAVLGWGAGTRAVLDPPVAVQVLSAAQRGSEVVVVDLPRYADPASVELRLHCDSLVVLTGLTLPAVTAAARVVTTAVPAVPRSCLVARGRVAGLDPEAVSATLGVPLAAVMGDQRGLAESVDLGLGPLRSRRGPLARAARATLSRLDVGGRGTAAA